MSKLIDLTGQRFERLVVQGIGGRKNGILWLCICDCGKECLVLGQNLKRSKQKSCGCLDRERKTKHNNSTRQHTSPEYRAWKNIKKRCYHEKDRDYHLYGGKGIIVCERWLSSFENFLTDMGERPSPKHSLDRIDSNGNYEPNNCRWATGTLQIINQKIRSDNSSGHKGVSWDKSSNKWFAYINPGGNKKRIRLGYFENFEDAVKARKIAEKKYHVEALAN